MPNAAYLSHLSTGPVFPGVIYRREHQCVGGWLPTWIAVWGSTETPCFTYDDARDYLLSLKERQ